jgi:hypothetical protein
VGERRISASARNRSAISRSSSHDLGMLCLSHRGSCWYPEDRESFRATECVDQAHFVRGCCPNIAFNVNAHQRRKGRAQTRVQWTCKKNKMHIKVSRCWMIMTKIFETIIVYCKGNLKFIGPCIILIVEWRQTNLMSLVLLFHHLLLNMFRMLVHPSSGAFDLMWIYFMCCIALVRCVLVLRCG